MEPLRIALYTDADVFAGTERHLVHLAHGLASCGVDVTVISPEHSPAAQHTSNGVIRNLSIPKRGKLDPSAIVTLSRLLRTKQIHILHAHNGRTTLHSIIARKIAGRGKVISTQHFITPAHATRTGVGSELANRVHHAIGHAVDHHISISLATATAMLARGETHAEKLTIVHNGIAAPTPKLLRPPELVRRELGISPQRLLLSCVARLEPEKNLVTLIEALSLIAPQLPDVACVIAGDGSQRAMIESSIRRFNLTEKVKLLGFTEDTLSLINASDIFVLPSLAEPFGLVLLEAMALGKPVIASAAGGLLEIVKELDTGILVPPLDVTAFANAICKLASDRMIRNTLGQHGKERYRAHFTVDQMVSNTLAVYSRTASNS